MQPYAYTGKAPHRYREDEHTTIHRGSCSEQYEQAESSDVGEAFNSALVVADLET